MDQKTIAWVSYLTIIGWIIALVSYNGSTDKSSVAKFHLRQSFGLMVLAIALWILEVIITVILFSTFALGLIWMFGMLCWLVGLGLLVFWILGIIAAGNGEEKPLPLFGAMFQKMFTFIN
jgi:uncharacterized membrane protein